MNEKDINYLRFRLENAEKRLQTFKKLAAPDAIIKAEEKIIKEIKEMIQNLLN